MSIKQGSSVRIISGSKRGSKLHFTETAGLRPSGDRIREMLFSWVQQTLDGSHCLDMFAGSGALGFEAASRGARHVTLMESNPVVVRSLLDNAKRLKFDNTEIVCADATARASYDRLVTDRQQSDGDHVDSMSIPCRYDLVFIDPPFADNLYQRSIEILHKLHLLNTDALVYLESDRHCEDLIVPATWELYRDKVAGEVRARLYRVARD